jgi:hypothetical protein
VVYIRAAGQGCAGQVLNRGRPAPFPPLTHEFFRESTRSPVPGHESPHAAAGVSTLVERARLKALRHRCGGRTAPRPLPGRSSRYPWRRSRDRFPLSPCPRKAPRRMPPSSPNTATGASAWDAHSRDRPGHGCFAPQGLLRPPSASPCFFEVLASCTGLPSMSNVAPNWRQP